MTVKGYKFLTKEDGAVSQQLLNDQYGIPISPTATTVQFSELCYPTMDEKYFLYWDERMTIVLGEPVDVVLPELPQQF